MIMKTHSLAFLVAIILPPAWLATAATRYVNVSNTAPASPYTNWLSAATNIQHAVDVADAGDLIFVTNGVYQTGAREVYGMTNRVAVTKSLTVRSVNGPAVTSIVGSGPGGPAAVRCVYLTNDAVLSGFTLTNGATQTSGDSIMNQSGGGLWCESGTNVVSNCVLTGNSASYGGGGAYSGTLSNCTLTSNLATEGAGAYSGILSHCVLTRNSASFVGGGAIGAALDNCVLTGNSAIYGGGANNCTLYGCTLVGNSASQWGGGAYYGALFNCISYYNQATDGPNHYSSSAYFCCTTPLPAGSGNMASAPLFVNTNSWGNLRLQAGSPCINAGNNAYVSGTVDLDGNSRIADDTVDMGAYEWVAPALQPSFTSYRWLTNAMELQLSGDSNRVFEIHASTNLIAWFWLATMTNNAGSMLYTNTGIAGQPMRFYRAIQLP